MQLSTLRARRSQVNTSVGGAILLCRLHCSDGHRGAPESPPIGGGHDGRYPDAGGVGRWHRQGWAMQRSDEPAPRHCRASRCDISQLTYRHRAARAPELAAPPRRLVFEADTMTTTIRALVLGLVLATADRAEDPGDGFTWDVSAERALFASAPTPLPAATDIAAAPSAVVATAYEVALVAQSGVRFVATPGKKAVAPGARGARALPPAARRPLPDFGRPAGVGRRRDRRADRRAERLPGPPGLRAAAQDRRVRLARRRRSTAAERRVHQSRAAHGHRSARGTAIERRPFAG